MKATVNVSERFFVRSFVFSLESLFVRMLAASFVVSLAAGCGLLEDEKDKEEEEKVYCLGDLGCGHVFKAEGSTVSIDLAEVSGTYVVSPFVTGDFKTVSGGVSGQNVVLEQTLASASDEEESPSFSGPNPRLNMRGTSINVSQPGKSKPRRSYSEKELSKMRGLFVTTMYNRFSREDFYKEDFQNLLSAYESVMPKNFLNSSPSLRDFFEKEANKVSFSSVPSLDLLDDCALSSIPVTGAEFDVVKVPATGDGFCIYKEDDGEELGVEVYDEIVPKIIDTYKILYGDTFPEASGFSFQPIVLLVNFSDEGGLLYDTLKDAIGIFDSQASLDLKRPLLIMPSNAISGRSSQNVIGTIAHELHHAIVYYYKVAKHGLNNEVLGLDEGLSHFFQDVFGDGTYNFTEYVTPYLSVWSDLVSTVIAGNQTTDAIETRGAAAAFIHYLANKNGNFEAKPGYISGKGVQYIVDYVKSKNTSTEGLDTYLGGKLFTTFGEFGVSLVVAGSDIESSDKRFSFGKTVAGTDFLGGKSVFGYTPNDKRLGNGSEIKTFEVRASEDFEAPYYGFMPTVLEGGKSTSFTVEEDGLGAFAVRIK